MEQGLRSAAKQLSAFEKRYGGIADVELATNYKSFLKDLKVAGSGVSNLRKSLQKPLTATVTEKGATKTAVALGRVDEAADKVDGRTVRLDVDSRGVLSAVGALNRAIIGGGPKSIVGSLGVASTVAHGTFALAIPAAIAAAVAALEPLMGGAGIGGSAVAAVGAGFGLIALSARQTFNKIEVENGKFVAKTDAILTRSQQNLVGHLNRAGKSYAKAFAPANDAFNRFAGRVVQTAERTFPRLGRAAEATTTAVGRAVDEVIRALSKPKQLASYERFLDAVPSITSRFTRATGNFFGGFVNILSEATPYAKDFARYVEDISRDFLKWSQSEQGREGMRKFFDSAARLAPKVADAIGKIARGLLKISRDKDTQSALGDLVESFGHLGDSAKEVNRAVDALKALNRWIEKYMGRQKGDPLFDKNFWKIPKIDFMNSPIKKALDRFGNWLGKWGQRAKKAIFQPFFDTRDSVIRYVSQMVGSVNRKLNAFGNALERIGSGIKKFWINRVWQPMATFVSQKAKGISQTLSNWKTKTVSWVRGLIPSVVNFWKNKVWQPMAMWVQTKRDGVMTTLANWKERAVSWVNSFRESVGSVWNKIWQGMADFVVAKKEGILQTVGNLASGIQSGFENIVGFINKVLNAVGLPTISIADPGNTKAPKKQTGSYGDSYGGAKGGVFHPSGRTEGLIPMASGGVIAQNAVGGMADGNTPRAVYGEVKKREYYIVPERKDNVPYLEGAAKEMGYGLVPDRSGNDGEKRHHHPHGMARGGILGALGAMGIPMLAKGRIWDTGSGEGQYGPTNNSLWDKATLERANRIIEKFAVAVNTYENHPPGYPQYAQSSIDAWDYAGRGTPIGYPSPHNEVKSFIESELSHGLKWTLGEGDSGHSGGYRHVHATWEPNGEAGSGGYSGGGGVMASLWDTVGSAMWNRLVQPPVNALAGRVGGEGNGVFGDIGAKLVTSTADKIKDYIIGESGSSGSITGGNSPSGLTIGEALSQGGWPENLLVPASSVVWHESGGNASARNPSSTATGLMQILHSTAQGVGADPNKLTDPIYNTSTGKKVYDQAGGFGPWVAAGRGGDYRNKPVTGYARGGVTEETTLKMPSPVKDAFLKVATTLASMAGYGPKDAIKIGDQGGIGTGKHLVGITNEAGPESIIPLSRKTPEGMAAYRAATPLYGKREHRGAYGGVPHFAAGGIATNGWNLAGGDGHLGIGGSAASDAIAAINRVWPGANVGRGSDINAYYKNATGGLTTSSGDMWVNAAHRGTPMGEALWGHEGGHGFGLMHGSGIMAPTVTPGLKPTSEQLAYVQKVFGGETTPHDGYNSGSGSPSTSSGSTGSSVTSVQRRSVTMSGGGSVSSNGVSIGGLTAGNGRVVNGSLDTSKVGEAQLKEMRALRKRMETLAEDIGRNIKGGVSQAAEKDMGMRNGIGRGQSRRARRVAAAGPAL